MTLLYGNIAPQMKGRLLNCLPGIRWVPHDIPAAENSGRDEKREKSKSRNKGRSKAQDKDERFPIHRRKSTISITSIPDPELDARTLAQGQSLFFSMLPIEIRKMVYELVMGEECIHLTLGARRRFGHFLCEEDDGEVEGGQVECGCRVLVGGKESRKLDRTGIRLLRVCRRIYSEAIPHLYNRHTFSLLHITHLLYLPSRLPIPRLNNIRTLRLRWAIRALPFLRRPTSKRYAYPEDTANWIRVWKILADMKGLKDLYIVISDPSPLGLWERGWLELEEKLLEPVRKITSPRWFELWLPYTGCRVDRDMGGCAVVLRKPNGEAVEEEGDDD